MQCPRCRTHDVYRSRSAREHVLSFFLMTVRCHRCCLLFSVPRWKHVPDKESTAGVGYCQPDQQQQPRRRAA